MGRSNHSHPRLFSTRALLAIGAGRVSAVSVTVDTEWLANRLDGPGLGLVDSRMLLCSEARVSPVACVAREAVTNGSFVPSLVHGRSGSTRRQRR